MPEDKGFDDLLGDLEDSLFKTEEQPTPEEEGIESETPKSNKTLPLLIDEKTATNICKDILKEKNQKKYEFVGVEVVFRPYWFFTYTCQLIIKDQDGNIADSEELGGREAIDAVTGQLADYLPEVMETEPIETVDLEEELSVVDREGTKTENPKIKEEELEKFIQQKISGVLRADKENVSVAGFELIYSPIWRFWLTIKKKTHSVQVCGTSGVGINYDELPLRPKTWSDIIIDNMKALKDPKKWSGFLKRTVSGAPTGAREGGGAIGKEVLALIVILIFLLYSLLEYNPLYVAIAIIIAGIVGWFSLRKRKNVAGPMPPQEAAPMPPPQPPP